MAVIIYQIGIFIAIYVSSFFGKSARNTIALLISLFTLIQVYMSWLLALQFITIFIAFMFSETNFDNNESKQVENKSLKNNNSQREPGIVYHALVKTQQVKKKVNRGFEVGCGFIAIIIAIALWFIAIKGFFSSTGYFTFQRVMLLMIFSFLGLIGWALIKSEE